MTTPRLHPNLGGEERAPAGGAVPQPVRAAARLWSLLFGHGAHADGPDGFRREDVWPEALGPPVDEPVFPWLVADDADAWWWRDTSAARRTHDKAFAWRTALDERLVPGCLRDVIAILEPSELADPAAARRAVTERVSAWPAWTRGEEGRFVLKPRLGSSGRGRVPGWALADGRPPADAAFARLADRGGAVLEPWLERRRDLSAQLWIDPDGGLQMLGTLELRVTPSGVWRGHGGTVDSRGRVGSGCEGDGALREAAAAVGVAAAAAGYRGPAGLDAFEFVGPDGVGLLRPVVEWNARFTMGIVAIGVLRRALRGGAVPRPRPGVLAGFAFGLDVEGTGADTRRRDPVQTLALDVGVPGLRPGLVYARDAAALDAPDISRRMRPSSIR